MSARVLYAPGPEAEASVLADFQRWISTREDRDLSTWTDLQSFAAEQYGRFWLHFLEWSGIEWEGDPSPACRGDAVEHATFFPNVRVNFAWNLLRPLASNDADWPAIIAAGEGGVSVRLSRGELRAEVSRVAAALAQLGVAKGQYVVAMVRNTPDTVVVALACAALGATWSSAAPDMGADVLLSRFGQLQPSLLVTHGEVTSQGVSRSLTDRLHALRDGLPSVRHVLALDTASEHESWRCPVLTLRSLPNGAGRLSWPALPFNHPLYVLFSSGTTGPPKGIVHGAGGTLLEHLKEHRLHGNLGPGDVMLYQTTCGWMMWNWLVSALGTGAAIVCYDGSPTYPTESHLWQVAAELGVTAFGTNPTYLAACSEAGLRPRDVADLSKLRVVLSTGSVLRGAQFEWVADHVGRIPVQSISGGTDIIGCFVLGNPLLPVYRGESQCISLGLDVRVMGDNGVSNVGVGELVCCRPFPSRPVGFAADPGGQRFHEAYFSQNEGVWTHGDRIELTERGTARVLGRSDGILNVRGVRVGPAEIYGVVLEEPGIRQAMAVEQPAPREPGGSRLVLLLVLERGLALDRALTFKLKKALASRLSANHVPAVIAQVEALPMTFSGKQSERAMRDALSGQVAVNLAALRNPESLDAILAHPSLKLQDHLAS